MLDILWAGMIITGVIYGALSGRMAEVTDGAIKAAGEAVTLCIAMVGVTAFWCGLMEIANKAQIIQKLTKGIQPFVSFLFPNIPKGHKVREHISMNIVANVLGLGWAATPSGLEAMKALDQWAIESRKDYRSNKEAIDEMCTFLVLNISSLQLIPVNMIVYRSQYGSVNPTAVIGPGIMATCVSTLSGIIFCKLMCCNYSKAYKK